MIAASEPQEFIPSGRQQIWRHSNHVNCIPIPSSLAPEAFLLHRMQRVTISDTECPEWWKIREASEPNACDLDSFNNISEFQMHLNVDHSSFSNITFDESSMGSWRTADASLKSSNQTVEPSFTKSILNKSRFSIDNEKNKSKSSNDTLNKYAKPEVFTLNNNAPNLCYGIEEELYIKGNTAILSKGVISVPLSEYSRNESRVNVCTYSMESPIKHALWCTFHCNRPTLEQCESISSKKPEVTHPDKTLKCICLFDSFNMRVFAENGEDFISNLQLQLSNIWNTKYGILLERDVSLTPDFSYFKSVQKSTITEDLEPTIYSLAHPLDEVRPVLFKQGSSLQIITDTFHKIVFTSENPSICMTFDSRTGLHSVSLIRPVNLDEKLQCYPSFSRLSTTPLNQSNSENASKFRQNTTIWCQAQSLGGPLAAGSPFCSRATSLSSINSPLQSRNQSPMAAISRCPTPSISPSLNRTSVFNRSARNQSINSPDNLMKNILDTSMMPVQTPELCLEHIWSDTQIVSKDTATTNSAAKNVFLSNDFVGQTYLCYLIPSQKKLHIARIEFLNNNKFIIGIVTSIPAKAALPLNHLHMMAILEPEGQVIIKSGLTAIGKLHIAGMHTGINTSPFIPPAMKTRKFSSPFPRRSSLLPHYNAPPEVHFDESVHLLSPVPTATPQVINQSPANYSFTDNNMNVHLSSLRDPFFNNLTLQYSNGTFYRIKLPALTEGSITRSCLMALKQSLQRDSAMTLLSRWYATRNTLGTVDISAQQEWNMFCSLLLSMLGYNIDKLEYGSRYRCNNSPSSAPKRKRTSDQGDDSDWFYLVKSDQNKNVENKLSSLLGIDLKTKDSSKSDTQTRGRINSSAVLFTSLPLVHFTLHLVYEELKLNMSRINELPLLVELLHQLAIDLKLNEYIVYYWMDFPNICPLKMNEKSQVLDVDIVKMNQVYAEKQPVSIMTHVYDICRRKEIQPYPFINFVNPLSRNILLLSAMVILGRSNECQDFDFDQVIKQIIIPGSRPQKKVKLYNVDLIQKAVLMMTEIGFTRTLLENLPPSISLLLHEALWQCRENPPTWWPNRAYLLLQRPDLAMQTNSTEVAVPSFNKTTLNQKLSLYAEPSQDDIRGPLYFNSKTEIEDGMDNMDNEILSLRFPNDRRIVEVRKLLQSSLPVTIRIVQRPEVTDHDFIEEQEKHLFAICARTMSLPVGRGMFTLRTLTPVITETLSIPRLCLVGKAPPRNTTIELRHIDTNANMEMWPLFHNGVAAGLRISPEATDIDSTWIVFNKPKGTDTPTEHAGFLMALGLNGHLKNLAVLNTYDYLVKFNEMTSLGLLLGLSATKRGTMDTATTKILSIHIEALLPPTSMELDVPQNVQVAALLGMGLVYQGSAHRHITEVLLTEIGRPPGPEMENCIDRESYSLAAGLALGLVTLGQGGKPSGLADLAIPDTLHYYMVGGNKRPLTGTQKDKYKVPSFQIREGSSVNLDVTAPGATLALGLMYLGSGSKAIADWMKPPDTQYLLDFVRPDFLLLRIVSRALILWNDIKPTTDWVESQIPAAIRPYCLVKPDSDMDPDIDFESMNQAYCNIIAGACFALGLRYAGSANINVYETLLHYSHMFTSLTGKSIADLAGKPTIETCLNLILLSLAMVMSGTGDLSVLRFIRHLRKRVSPTSSAMGPYGAHLAMHMALGLLFLGGGKLTLSSTPSAVAAMLCAFFPKFPTHSNDNRYHLQAFRHLYVLAVEPRLIIPRDVLQKTACYANLKLVFVDGTITKMRAPCILPELSTLSKISVNDDRYWSVTFERERNWEQLLTLLKGSGSLVVKQRAGCLSYLEDPLGSLSLLSRTITKTSFTPWTIHPNDISSFSSDPIVNYFKEQFLDLPKTLLSSSMFKCEIKESVLRKMLATIAYECVRKDKIAILSTWITLIKALDNLNNTQSSHSIWQIKILCAQILSETSEKSLISSEYALSIQQYVSSVINSWEPMIMKALHMYFFGHFMNEPNEIQNLLSCYVNFYDIPYKMKVIDSCDRKILKLLLKMSELSLSTCTINKLSQMLIR